MGGIEDSVFTIGIGGAAGDGVREAGISVGNLLSLLGYEVVVTLDYPSIIRGGHNFSRISFSKEKVWNDYRQLDLLVALNEETLEIHKDELFSGSILVAEKFTDGQKAKYDKNAIVLPMLEKATGLQAPPITRSSMGLGALCYLLGLPVEVMLKDLHRVFKEKKLAANIKLAEMGYDHLKEIDFHHPKIIKANEQTRVLIDGNTAFAKGLMAAGLDFYLAYPMTPSTSILHYLASQEKVKTIQPENELAVINMALGLAYTGKRVAIGSATGGFALMQEAFSFAGISELPLVVAVSQRQAPATGVPTHTSQADLRFVLSTGHGEFPRVVLAPGSPDEAFEAGVEALNLAWSFQIPVIVLLDKILSENPSTNVLNQNEVKVEKGKMYQGNNSEYLRYQITKDGISPLLFPGTKDADVKITSYEHDEEGIAVDDPKIVKKMIDKRFAKLPAISASMGMKKIKTYGSRENDVVIVFWGSTKGPVLEAVKHLGQPIKCLQILSLEPFDGAGVIKALKGAKQIINVEANHNGQLASLIREKTGIEMTDSILKYDSKPFETVELAEQLEELI